MALALVLTPAIGTAAGGSNALTLAALRGRADCAPLPPPEGRIVRVASEPELQAALRSLRSDTTILLADGEYRLSNTLHLRGGLERVAIRGASGDRERVLLRGRGMRNPDYANVPHGILVSDARQVLIADLSIVEVYFHAVQLAGEAGAADIALYNLRLAEAGEQLVKGSSAGPPGPYADRGLVACSWIGYADRARDDYTNGVDVLAGADWIVRDNDFVNIRAPAGQLAGPAVLFWRNSLRTRVERNRFVGCDRAIALGLAAPDPRLARDGEARFDHQAGVIRNNMVYRAAGGPTGDIGISVNHHPDFAILHNTVIQNGSFPQGTIEYRFASSSGRIQGNLSDGPIWRRDGASAELADNLSRARPDWFEDAASGDLHLRPEAEAAIDQAPPLADLADDFDAQPRPRGARADIGADEWWPEAGPDPTRSPSPSSTPASTATPAASPTASPTPSPTPTSEAPPAPILLLPRLARGG